MVIIMGFNIFLISLVSAGPRPFLGWSYIQLWRPLACWNFEDLDNILKRCLIYRLKTSTLVDSALHCLIYTLMRYSHASKQIFLTHWRIFGFVAWRGRFFRPMGRFLCLAKTTRLSKSSQT